MQTLFMHLSTCRQKKRTPGIRTIATCASMACAFPVMVAQMVNAETCRRTPFLNGGMFYHLGPARISAEKAGIGGLTMGLGGRIAFTVARSIRLGGMGFGSGFTYQSAPGVEGSYVSLRAGGVTAEYVLSPTNRFSISLGILAGGARLNHLDIISASGNVKVVTFENYRTMVGAPLLLVELPFGKSYCLAFAGTWILGNNIAFGNSYGPCFHVGFLFNK